MAEAANDDYLGHFKVKQLKEILKAKGLPVKGVKDELINRIRRSTQEKTTPKSSQRFKFHHTSLEADATDESAEESTGRPRKTRLPMVLRLKGSSKGNVEPATNHSY